MTTSASTTSRLLRLLSMLQARRDWSGAALAERLQISSRTVRRDVERLRELGYSIQSTTGLDGGYRLDAGTDLPPLLFDEEQALALAVALQSSTGTGAQLDEAALRALTTVRLVMPARLRHRFDSMRFTAMPSRPGAVTVSTAVLLELSLAIRSNEVLRFDYATADAAPAAALVAPRRVEPHDLVNSNGRWYLVAWDLDRDDWRIFRADRVTPRTPTGPRFSPRDVPGGDVREFVRACFAGAEPGEQWARRGSATLHLPASAARPYIGDGSVEALGAERCRVELAAWSWMALAAAFAAFDADLEEVKPRELELAFHALGQRLSAVGA